MEISATLHEHIQCPCGPVTPLPSCGGPASCLSSTWLLLLLFERPQVLVWEEILSSPPLPTLSVPVEPTDLQILPSFQAPEPALFRTDQSRRLALFQTTAFLQNVLYPLTDGFYGL